MHVDTKRPILKDRPDCHTTSVEMIQARPLKGRDATANRACHAVICMSLSELESWILGNHFPYFTRSLSAALCLSSKTPIFFKKNRLIAGIPLKA